MVNKKQPEIRFPEFSEDWKSYRLNEVVEKQIKGKAKLDKLGSGSVEYLDALRLNGGFPLLSDGKKDVEKEDILILWDGSKAGTVYYGFEGVLGSTLKAYKTNINGNFVYQFLKFHQEDIYSNYRTPNIPHVQKDFLDVFKIDVPDLAEQKQISSLFKRLDEIISLHQQELTKLKQTKQGFLQKMFPKEGEKVPEVRFPGFIDNWEQRILGEMFENLESGVSVNSSDEETGYFILKTSAVKSGGIDLKEVKAIIKEELRRAKTPIKKNSIIISRMNTPELVGASGLVFESKDNIYLPDRLWQGQVNKDFSAEWLIQSLNTASSIRKIRDLATGTSGSMKNISKKAILDFDLNIPELEEQKRIGTFFKKIDETIALHQRELELLQITKKAFLQKLFV